MSSGLHRERVAVVGVGPAGAIAAAALVARGLDVIAFDKGRGAGGRLSTRRAGEHRFDHGAQYFTVKSPAIASRLEQWERKGVVAPWSGPFGTLHADGFRAHTPRSPRYVAVPGMNALLKHLLAGVDARFGTRVTALSPHRRGWSIHTEHAVERADRLVLAVPAPQAVPLLGDHRFGDILDKVAYAPCWTAMAAVQGTAAWSAVRVTDSPLAWVARNQTKPGRPPGQQWVLQASPEWSAAHLENEPEDVARALHHALLALPGMADLRIDAIAAHRWRYALVTDPVGVPCMHDPVVRLTVCGDGLLGGRVESALLSGQAAAGLVAQASDRR